MQFKMRGAPITSMSSLVACAVLGLTVAVTLAAAQEINPSGEHVCKLTHMENVGVLRNRTYTCWEWQALPGTHGCYGAMSRWRHGRFRHRGFYRMHQCFMRVRRTCTREVYRCVLRPRVEYYCCEGYETDTNGNCVETSECANDNGGCHHTCHHTGQSQSYCSCRKGYRLDPDGLHCSDMNECIEGTSGCNHVCENTNGGFYCTCRHGYQLTSPTMCLEIDECSLGNAGCEQICTNKNGSFYCSCEAGFRLERGADCSDEDECLQHNGGCSDTCVNLYGSHRCACADGRVLSADLKTCTDDMVNITTTQSSLGGRLGLSRSSLGTLENPSAILIGLIAGCALLALLVIIAVCVVLRMRKKARDAAPPAGVIVAAAGGATIVKGGKTKNLYESLDPPPPYSLAGTQPHLTDIKVDDDSSKADDELYAYANMAFVSPITEKQEVVQDNLANEASSKVKY